MLSFQWIAALYQSSCSNYRPTTASSQIQHFWRESMGTTTIQVSMMPLLVGPPTWSNPDIYSMDTFSTYSWSPEVDSSQLWRSPDILPVPPRGWFILVVHTEQFDGFPLNVMFPTKWSTLSPLTYRPPKGPKQQNTFKTNDSPISLSCTLYTN